MRPAALAVGAAVAHRGRHPLDGVAVGRPAHGQLAGESAHAVQATRRWAGSGATRLGRIHEGGEQRSLLGHRLQRLGVPLHADHELAVHRLDRLDRSVGRAPCDHQPVTQPGNALVVKGVDLGVSALQHPGDAAGLPDRDRMGGLRSRLGLAMVDLAGADVGQVLVQRPASGHVEHLHARGRWPGSASRGHRRRGPGRARSHPARSPRARWPRAGSPRRLAGPGRGRRTCTARRRGPAAIRPARAPAAGRPSGSRPRPPAPSGTSAPAPSRAAAARPGA